MAYKENPNFPNNPVDPVPVNNQLVRNLDNKKIIDELQSLIQRVEQVEQSLQQFPGAHEPKLFQAIQEVVLPGNNTVDLDGKTANFFSIDNQQEGFTGNILVSVRSSIGSFTFTIKPGVIYNSPQFPNSFYELETITNNGEDAKTVILYKV